METVFAKECVTAELGITGSCIPQAFKCNDNNTYIVKFFHQNVGIKVLPNEYICYSLAQELGLPTYPTKLVEVHYELLTDTKYSWLKGGLQFGIMYDFYARTLNANSASNISNKEDVAKIFVFDQWVYNLDHGNEFANWLCSLSNFQLLKTIDNSHVFCGNRWNQHILQSSTEKFENFKSHQVVYAALSRHISSSQEIIDSIDQINQIPEEKIKEIVFSVPQAWNFSHQERLTVIDYLITRRALLLDHMKKQKDIIPKVG
jgi:hypothetical protein